MATKKEDKKSKRTITKAFTVKKEKPKVLAKQEDVYPAIDIVKQLNVSSFDFFMIKNATGIEDGTLVTMSDFQKYYKKIVEGR